MSWITPTEADILTRVSAPELEAFRGAALGEDQADPVDAQITQVVDFMRSYIARCGSVVMSDHDDGTIPRGGLHVFLDLIVPVIQKRPAGALIDASGIRLDSKSDAMRWLRDAADCKIAVDESPPADAPSAPPATPLYNKPCTRRAGL